MAGTVLGTDYVRHEGHQDEQNGIPDLEVQSGRVQVNKELQ